MATATTRRKASLSSAERKIVVLVVYVVVKLIMSSEAAKNINISTYYSLTKDVIAQSLALLFFPTPIPFDTLAHNPPRK